MYWAIFGSEGMLGMELVAYLRGMGEQVAEFNRANFASGVDQIKDQLPTVDIIVNAIGYTQVDSAEFDIFQAAMSNIVVAGQLAELANLVNAKYFYVSTDYIFDGSAKHPYAAHAKPNPLNVYGRTKCLGEKISLEISGRCSIFRTSWLYGIYGDCFPRAIVSKLLIDGKAEVVDDQIGIPTWTHDLARVIFAHGIQDYKDEIVHAVSSGFGSWFDFAREIAKSMPDGDGYLLRPLSTFDLPTKAKRPAFSALDNTETAGPIIGDWHERWQVAAPFVLKNLLVD